MKLIRHTVETTLKCDTSECCRHRDILSDDDIVIECDIGKCGHYVRVDGRGTGSVSGHASKERIVREIASHAAMELSIE